jgi:hypothetical protein
VVGCISGAILAWQRIDDLRVYSVVVAITLAAAVSLHYYAILVWPAFLIAETSVWVFHRRFRITAWAALLVGAVPLLLFAPLLLKLRQYYGRNFWAKPSIKEIFLAQDWLFTLGGHWGVLFAAGITVLVVYISITRTAQSSGSGHRQVEVHALPIADHALTLMLLWLPVLAVAAARVSHGGMTERYMLPTVLGGALALGYVIDTMPSAGRLLLLILMMMDYSASSVSIASNLVEGSLLETRTAATRDVKAIARQFDGSALPIVISDGTRYLPMAYYTPADSNAKLYAIVDPYAAVSSTESKSDSVDLALLVLRRYFPLQVEDYNSFVSRHREFLVVLGGGPFEWWPARLAHDGYTLRLLSTEGRTTVYKVTVSP